MPLKYIYNFMYYIKPLLHKGGVNKRTYFHIMFALCSLILFTSHTFTIQSLEVNIIAQRFFWQYLLRIRSLQHDHFTSHAFVYSYIFFAY